MANRFYRAICFDLDGTLLPMELDGFMQAYFQSLGAYVARFGVAPQDFSAGMKAGIKAMAAHDDARPNSDAFWEGFLACVDRGAADWEGELAAYYDREFGAIGNGVIPSPAAARAVNTLAAKGYPLALTTMPMFPRRAVEWRLEWAGVDPALFSRITSFENSTSVKPKLAYYAENLAALGVSGNDVLMVGNNTKEDLAFMGLGADAFLVTDLLLDPIGFDVSSGRNGTLEAVADWAESLPVCADPATGIEAGLVSMAARDEALASNGCPDALAADAAVSAAGFSINGVEG